jgi:hypothetical protein
MRNVLVAISLFLTSFSASAAIREAEETVTSAPAELVDMVYVVLFLIAFFGMIGWFFFYMWRNHKNGKSDR